MPVSTLFVAGRQQFVDEGGLPIAFGKLYIGQPDQDPKVMDLTVYADRALTVPLAQPILLDELGRTAVPVWVGETYSYVLDGPDDVQIDEAQYIEVADIPALVAAAVADLAATLRSGYLNLIVNGAMSVAGDAAVPLTGSFQEGQVRSVWGLATNVSAGDLDQNEDDAFGVTGWSARFAGVTCPSTGDYIEAQFRILGEDAIRLSNRAGMFSALVDHDIGSDVDFRVTFARANALNDFSAVTAIDVGPQVAVPTGEATRISFTTPDMGDCSNGVAITVRVFSGQITTKNVRFTEAQMEVGAIRTEFQTLGFEVVSAAILLDQIAADANEAIQEAVQSIQSLGVNWTSPELLGSALTIAGISFCAIAGMSANEIALYEPGAIGELRWYRFNGSTWSEVGTGLVRTGGSAPAITKLSSARVALFDSGNQQLGAYDWNGSSWSLVGSLLTISSDSSDIAALTSSVIVKATWSSTRQLRAYSFDGSSWSAIGNAFSLPPSETSKGAICAINSTDIAYIDPTSDDLRVYRFDGTDFSQVGNEKNIPGSGNPTLTSLGGSDVVLYWPAQFALSVHRFDGTDWAQSGYTFNLVGSLAGMSSFNGTDIAWCDPSTEELRCYRFGFQLGSGPFEPA